MDDIADLFERLGVSVGSGITKARRLEPLNEKDKGDIDQVLGIGATHDLLKCMETNAREFLQASARIDEVIGKDTSPVNESDISLEKFLLSNTPENMIETLGFEAFADDEWFASTIMLDCFRCQTASKYDPPSASKIDPPYSHKIRLDF